MSLNFLSLFKYFQFIMIFFLCQWSVGSPQPKVVRSEFFNQATFGSEGPMLTELELAGSRTFLLTYNIQGQESLSRSISLEDYTQMRSDLKRFLSQAQSGKLKSASKELYCDREITYTRVDEVKKVTTESICWGQLAARQRVQLSNWFISIRRKFL